MYLGFNTAGINGRSVPHAFVEVVEGGQIVSVFEYGPGANDQLSELDSSYQNSQDTAASLFQIQPPAGMSTSQFINLAVQTGKNLDAYLAANPTPYSPNLGDCYTTAQAILQSLGVSPGTFGEAGIIAASNAPNWYSGLLSLGAVATSNQQSTDELANKINGPDAQIDPNGSGAQQYYPDGKGGWLKVIGNVSTTASPVPGPGPSPDPSSNPGTGGSGSGSTAQKQDPQTTAFQAAMTNETMAGFFAMGQFGDFQIDVSTTTEDPFTV